MSKKVIVTALILMPLLFSCTSKQESGSRFGGVQIGAITYSWRDLPGGVENIIKYCKESGITSIELMSSDVEAFLGAPQNPMRGMFGPRPGAQQGAGAPPQTPPPAPAAAPAPAPAPAGPPAGARDPPRLPAFAPASAA